MEPADAKPSVTPSNKTITHLQKLWVEAGQTADKAKAELPEMERRAAALKGKEATPIITNGQIEQYDPAKETFPTYLQRNNDTIFDRYAATIQQLLTTRPDLITDDRSFYDTINPAGRPVNPPLSLEEQRDLVKRLDQLAVTGVNGRSLAHDLKGLQAEIATSPERTFGANYNLRGTGKPSEAVGRPTLRKIYLAPDIRGIDRFAQSLYEGLERDGVRIYGAKIHTEDFDTDSNSAVVAQAHNTMVIYLEDDAETQRVMQAVLQAEQQSGVPLATFRDDEVVKTALIAGKMMVGVDEASARLSFDNIANALANKGRSLFKDGKRPTVAEIKAAMTEELKFRNGKNGNEYLSLSTTAQAATHAQEDAVELDIVRGRLNQLGSAQIS